MNDLDNDGKKLSDINTSIAPWISVVDGAKAVEFYKHAFNGIETYRLDAPDGGLIVRLSINGAEFWVSGSADEEREPKPAGGGMIRMILTVPNPQSIFEQALKAGATEVFPVGEGHGWLLGRIIDPFGLHWEIGHPLELS